MHAKNSWVSCCLWALSSMMMLPLPSLAQSGFPNGDNTGLYRDDGSLTAFCQGVCSGGVSDQAGAGLFNITRDGEIVECQNFGGKQINLNGYDNVVLRCVAGASITSNGSGGRTHSALIEHVTLDVGGRGKTKVIVGVFGNEFWGSAAAPFIIRRTDISGGEDGISLGAGEHVHIIENYIHGLVGITGPGCENDCHSDAIHLTARGPGIVIRGNTLDARPVPGTGQTNAAFFGDLNFGSSGLVFDQNYLLGANITAYHIGRRPPNGNGECPVATQWRNNVVLAQERVYTNAQTADGLIECPVVDGQGGVWSNNTCVSDSQTGSAEWQTDGRCSGTFGETQPSCSDGVQNGAEQGIDCGGSCPSCDGFQDAGPSDGGLSTMDPVSRKLSGGCSAQGGSTSPVPAIALAGLAAVMRRRRK